MTSNQYNDPGDSKVPDESLDFQLSQLAREEAEDVARARQMQPAAHEEDILNSFRNQMEEAAHKPRSFRRWIWPALAAASAAMIFAVAGPDFGPAQPDDNPWMGAGEDDTIRITSHTAAKVWFEWNFEAPRDGYFVVKVLDESESPLASSEELRESRWCYDVEENGPLPDSFRTEVCTWDSLNGLEELSDVISRDFRSSR